MTDSWSQPPTSLRAGDELERTIKVTVAGNFHGQIPDPVPPESRAILQTRLSVLRNETITENTVISTAEYTFRVRAQSPIPVFLDTVRMPWWNTEINEASEAIIPARRINVGLPDRADLLAEIALQETGTNRFINWLKGTSWLRLVIYILAFFSFLYLLLTTARQTRPAIKSIVNTYQLKSELLAMSDNPLKLYEHLIHLKRGQRIDNETSTLEQRLQGYLFNEKPEPLTTSEIESLINLLCRQSVANHRHSSNAKTEPGILAEL